MIVFNNGLNNDFKNVVGIEEIDTTTFILDMNNNKHRILYGFEEKEYVLDAEYDLIIYNKNGYFEIKNNGLKGIIIILKKQRKLLTIGCNYSTIECVRNHDGRKVFKLEKPDSRKDLYLLLKTNCRDFLEDEELKEKDFLFTTFFIENYLRFDEVEFDHEIHYRINKMDESVSVIYSRYPWIWNMVNGNELKVFDNTSGTHCDNIYIHSSGSTVNMKSGEKVIKVLEKSELFPEHPGIERMFISNKGNNLYALLLENDSANYTERIYDDYKAIVHINRFIILVKANTIYISLFLNIIYSFECDHYEPIIDMETIYLIGKDEWKKNKINLF